MIVRLWTSSSALLCSRLSRIFSTLGSRTFSLSLPGAAREGSVSACARTTDSLVIADWTGSPERRCRAVKSAWKWDEAVVWLSTRDVAVSAFPTCPRSNAAEWGIFQRHAAGQSNFPLVTPTQLHTYS